MVSSLTLAATVLALASSAFGLQINSPSGVTVCQPTSLNWSGGAAPYYLTIIPGGDPSGAPLATLLSDTPLLTYTWNVNLAAGSSVTFQIKDSTGTPAYSSAVTILAGSSTSCLTSTAVATGAAAGTSGPGAAASGTTATAGTSAAGTTKATSSTPSAASSKATSSVSGAKSLAASTLLVGAGIAASFVL